MPLSQLFFYINCHQLTKTWRSINEGRHIQHCLDLYITQWENSSSLTPSWSATRLGQVTFLQTTLGVLKSTLICVHSSSDVVPGWKRRYCFLHVSPSLLNRLLRLWIVSYPLSTIYYMLKIIAKLLPPTVIMESCIVSYLQCGLLTIFHPCSLDLKLCMTGNQNMMRLRWHRLLLFKYSNLDSGGQLLSPAPPPGDSQQPRSLLFAS